MPGQLLLVVFVARSIPINMESLHTVKCLQYILWNWKSFQYFQSNYYL